MDQDNIKHKEINIDIQPNNASKSNSGGLASRMINIFKNNVNKAEIPITQEKY